MKFYYITFRSVTYAQRGEKLLNQKNIRCTLQRTPRWMEEQGCGYCLRVWTNNIGNAEETLQQALIPVKRIYLQRSDGLLEEVSL